MCTGGQRCPAHPVCSVVEDFTNGVASLMTESMQALSSLPEASPCCRRYYICDKKLSALGWTEKTSWEAGLKKTIDWYLEHGFESRWVGDVERALAAHPKAQ